MGLLGATYETPAEIRMLRALGRRRGGHEHGARGDRAPPHGRPAAAVTCITNLAAGLAPGKLDHAEVETTAKRSRERFTALLSAWVRRVGQAVGA